MATVSTYLNFPRSTESAFDFYKKVFGTELLGVGYMRFRDMPPIEGMPDLPQEDLDLVMHCTLPILGGHHLMGSDVPESMGFRINSGNNIYLNLEPDTRAETKRLFNALSEGGSIEQPLQDMFWGDYYGSCTDKFGVHWMFNCAEKA